MANYIATDTDLTAVADAIREKGGTSAQLAFPTGFVDAIDAIQTGGGGGISLAEFASGAKPTGEVDITGLTFVDYAFAFHPNITSVVGSGYFNKGYLFTGCTGITKVNITLSGSTSGNFFSSCTGLKTAVLNQARQGGSGMFNGCSSLEVADVDIVQIRNNYFYGNAKLQTVILRKSSAITTLESTTGAIAFNTPFKSGGTGGIIYIPKALYDHLGDGSALDYKAATNWSTIDGYGTITWAQIEGSIYETQYADGTPIT